MTFQYVAVLLLLLPPPRCYCETLFQYHVGQQSAILCWQGVCVSLLSKNIRGFNKELNVSKIIKCSVLLGFFNNFY